CGDRVRASDPLVDPLALLRHRLPWLVRLDHHRRRDHRGRQRRARRGGGMTTQTPNLPNRKENPMEKTQLKTAQLGTTGLEITRVGLGAWAIGGGGYDGGW